MKPFELLELKFSPHYEEILSKLQKIDYYEPCNCCGRTAKNFNNEAYLYTDSSKKTYAVCKFCAMANQQNAEFMGYANGPVGYTLCSFKGGYLNVPLDTNKPAELWSGGKYLERLKPSKTLTIVDCTGHRAKLAQLSNREPRLTIALSPRRERWLRYLRFSSEQQLNVATEQGMLSVNYDDFEQLKNSFEQSDLSKSNRNSIISMLRMNKTNRIAADNRRFIDVMEKCSDEMLDTIRNVSQEPLGFLFMLDALSAI